VHIVHGLPLCIISSILAVTVSFGILSLFIVSVCIYHGHLSDFYEFYNV
jgi:hypothetical protein